MKNYQVEGIFSFIHKSNSPEQVRQSLIKIIKREGLSDENFEIKISRITEWGSKSDSAEDIEEDIGKEVIHSDQKGSQKIRKTKVKTINRRGKRNHR